MLDNKIMQSTDDFEPNRCCDDPSCQTECVDWDMLNELSSNKLCPSQKGLDDYYDECDYEEYVVDCDHCRYMSVKNCK